MECSKHPEDLQSILREEVENAVAAVKKGSLQELTMYQQNFSKEGETMINVLTKICNKILKICKADCRKINRKKHFVHAALKYILILLLVVRRLDIRVLCDSLRLNGVFQFR